MRPGVVDGLALAYVLYGVARGRRRGLFQELPGAISVTVFLITGCGLYRWGARALLGINHVLGQILGVAGFAGLVGGGAVLIRELRVWIGRWAHDRYGSEERQQTGGAIAGGVRCFAWVVVALLVFAQWPLHGITRPITESSVLGRGLTRFVLPVYEKTHGAL